MALTEKQKNSLLEWGKAGVVRQSGMGADKEELKETYAKIGTLAQWCPEFSKLAFKHEQMGDEAEEPATKAAHYLKAAAYYHIGEMFIYGDNEEKRSTYRRMVAVYARATKYLPSVTDLVEIPFGDFTLSAYFRHVPSVKKAPCVILVRGVDAAKEAELHLLGESLLKQRIHTLAIDLPGQGEARFRGLKMSSEFEKPVAAAVDYLLFRSDVDGSRIGLWGMSFGGFIAPRAAALEKRIKACISLGGCYSLDEFDVMLTVTLNCINNMKITEKEWPQKRKEYSLEGFIQKLSRPLLVVNGSADVVFPIAQSTKIYDKAPGPKDLKVYDGYAHCVFYELPEALTYMATWMKQQLTK